MGLAALAALGSDARVVARALVRRPGYTALVVIILALGIGANTMIFNLVNTYLFAPLPFREGDRLVHVRDVIQRPGEASWWYTPSPRTFYAVRDGFSGFSSVAAHSSRRVTLGVGDDATQILGGTVSDQWLETLGIVPVLGRGFSRDEQAAGSTARVVLLSNALWTERFGADTAALRRPIQLDGEPYLPIGVLPPGFRYPYGAALWFLEDFDRNSGVAGTSTVARLAPAISRQSARAALAQFSGGVADLFPDTHRDITLDFVSMREQLFGNRPRVGLVLLGAVGLLLLIAGVNVAAVMQVRVLSRDHELAVRRALGSSRWRLFRLVFLEGALLAAAGGCLAWLAAWGSRDALMGVVSSREAGLFQVATTLTIDARVIGFAGVVTLAVTLIASLGPALQAVHPRSVTVARGPGTGLSRRARRLYAGAVVLQTSFAVVLLLGASLIVDSYRALTAAARGYDPEGRLVVPLALPDRRFSDGASRVRAMDQIVERLQAQPGVLAAGFAHHLPVTPGDWTRAYSIEGVVASEPGRPVLANVRWIGRTYFDAMGMPLLHGRSFSATDLDRNAEVVILSADLAAKHFGNANPVGRRFKLGELGDNQPWKEIVGVVAQAREEWAFPETFYLPYSSRPLDRIELVIHSGPGASVPAIRAAIREVDPGQAADRVEHLSDQEAEDLRSDYASVLIITLFSLGGLALSLLGTYTVMSHTIRQKNQEIGIRLALGSSRSGLLLHLLKGGVSALGLGVAAGSAVAMVVFPVTSPLLATAGDAVAVQLLSHGLELRFSTFLAVSAAVLATGTAACLLPVKRAVQSDPVQVLKQ